ncbi:MAG: indole-3-glycerol-phosphate synthase [Spirochaetes bacterium]|nr:MAG: indole-3-glycerol-phosphate synthase [Spirochaetota bacterium]
MKARFSLDAMRARKLAELPALKKRLREAPARTRRLHGFAPAPGAVTVIAELKQASPSAGKIRTVEPVAQARAYERGGAGALSVLTDGSFFGGSYDDLEAVCASADLPVLCKEFVYFPEQVECAYRAGADMVLLIARALGARELRDLYARVAVTGMIPLVEIHESGELVKVLPLQAPLLMVNSRNLETLAIDRAAAARTLGEIPRNVGKIAASGIESRADMEPFLEMGARGFLVGSALMKSADPASMIRELRDVR